MKHGTTWAVIATAAAMSSPAVGRPSVSMTDVGETVQTPDGDYMDLYPVESDRLHPTIIIIVDRTDDRAESARAAWARWERMFGGMPPALLGDPDEPHGGE